MGETLDVKVAELDQRSKSNTRRIDKLEQSTDALHELTIAVREMVLKQDYTKASIDDLDKKVDGIDSRIDELESKPGKRWEKAVVTILTTVVAAIVGFLLARIGM